MATKKKMLQAAAGNAGGGGPLNVEDVFSTYLYSGTSVNPNVISNNIDLAGEGGMVWLKTRTAGFSHTIFDTERGVNKYLYSDTTGAEGTGTSITSFNSDGFTLGTTSILYNSSSYDYASWTFRKAPKFFDVVTWSGDNVVGREIPHSLGSTPGCIIMKATSVAQEWVVYHRSNTANPETEYLVLNTTAATADYDGWWDDTAPTSTNFTLGIDNNQTGRTYVAYLFAHNNGDGEFGPDSDQDIIKCGSYTGNGDYLNGKYVDVGFEPQWILQKAASTTGPWLILDTMRGWDVNTGNKPRLLANATNAEANSDSGLALVSGSGFTIYDTSSKINGNGQDYIYIAIRRGTKVPESATEVFAATNMSSSTLADTGFAVDLSIDSSRTSTSSNFVNDRLRGSGVYMNTDGTTAEQTGGSRHFDSNQGVIYTSGFTGINWSWKRAPGHFDAVAFSGTGSARTVSHNLGVAPEMMWVKERSQSENWRVYHKDVGTDAGLSLNLTNGEIASTTFWNNTAPTDTVLSVNSNSTNESSQDYIAYLFASLDGISKVGSYTGNGTSQTIDCGFTSGARFVLIKETSGTSPWHVFDTERGIVAGNDPRLKLDNTGAQTTTQDFIDPAPSGFAVTSSSITNGSGDEYIFYAIA